MTKEELATQRERKKLKTQIQKRFNKLKNLVVERCGKFEQWKEPIAWQGAQLQFDIEEMMLTVSVEGRTITEEGSNQQTKRIAHPLLPHLKDAHRSLTIVLNALQLTPSSTFKKMENNTPLNDNDPTAEWYNTIKQ